MRPTNFKYTRIALICTSALGMFAAGSAAQAQESGATDADAPAIVITGSRIQRRDYEANSPIVTAGQELLQNNSTAAIETSLNKLPAFTPVQTPALAGDVQPTATSTPGAATVSLRNLGTNRNLVLVDGRRATPANALGVVDINTIPAAAIERVEVITGGASATYGADAVGGVVNFILKKNFQGLQLDGQMGISQRGDGREFTISGIMGTNFDDGRGNITIGLSMNNRNGANRRDRPWFRDVWKDPKFTGTEFFPAASGFQPIGANAPSQAAVNSIFGVGVVPGDRNGAGVPTGFNSSRFYFNPNGTAFTGFFQSPAGGSGRFNGDLTGLKWKRQADGTLGQNFLDEPLLLPLERYNMYARGQYEINDWIGVFAQGTFTRVQTTTVQQPSPSVNGWAAAIPVDGRAIPTELATLLSSRPNPTAAWQLTYYLDYANRSARTDVFTYNLTAGFEGKIPGTDWTWELYGSQGESETSAVITGTASLERFRAIVSAPNWGRGFRAQGNAAFGGFGASTATCTSGFDPFNKTTPSQDCLDAIRADLKNRAVMQQTVWEANAQGGLIDLPAGQLRAAVGATHRQNRYTFENDTLTTQGTSFLDQTIGIYPSGNSKGLIRVDEIYGELLVPVLANLPFVKKLELEIGARNSHYNTTGNAFTWKAMGDWQVTDWLRIRGGFNKAVRAPNVAELYLAPQQTFTAAGGGDVCRLNNGLAWSANPAANSNAANVLATCRILMNQSIAGTADKFYSDPQFFNAAGPAFAFPTLVGNPNVRPEEAKTWTIGTVINSPFSSDMFRRLRLSVDYYNIKVDDAIGPLTLDTAQRQCFDPTFNAAIANNPTAAAATAACQAIGRVAGDGALGNVQVTYLNNGRFRTQGIDVQLDWAFPAGPGTFSVNTVFNYLLSLKSAPLPASAGAAGQLVEYAGTLGPAGSAAIAENGLNPGAFRWKLLNTFSYSLGPVSLSLQWQHLPAAKSITYPANNATTFAGTPAYDLFNLSGSFKVTKEASLRWGVDNLFDKAPPLSEYNTAANATTLANGIGASPFNAYFYDLNGRRFYIGGTVKF